MNLEKLHILTDGVSPDARITLSASTVAEMIAEIERLRGIDHQAAIDAEEAASAAMTTQCVKDLIL